MGTNSEILSPMSDFLIFPSLHMLTALLRVGCWHFVVQSMLGFMNQVTIRGVSGPQPYLVGGFNPTEKY